MEEDPHSSQAAEHFTDTGAGVTDEDYKWNGGGVLFHFDKEKKFEVKKGNWIAQPICDWNFLSRNRGSLNFRWQRKGLWGFWFH